MADIVTSALPLSEQREHAINSPTPTWFILLALSMGTALGALAPRAGQAGIDGALVLAGIVQYPPGAPMGQYFRDSWTIIHQGGALLLRVGLDQSHLAMLLTIFPRAISVGGYALIFHGFTQRPWFSLCAALLCFLAFFSNPVDQFFASPAYPLPGYYAFWAHVGVIWVIGCLAAGRSALTAFSALILITVHPIIGLYTVSLLAVTLLLTSLYFRIGLRGYLRGAALGASIVTLSFVIYLKMHSSFSAETDGTLYDTYMQLWDIHRDRPMTGLDALRVGLAAALGIIGLAAFLRFGRPKQMSSVLATGLVMLALLASTAAYFATYLIPEYLPEVFLRAMPARLLNVHAYVALPIAAAVMARLADRFSDPVHHPEAPWSEAASSRETGRTHFLAVARSVFGHYARGRFALLAILVMLSIACVPARLRGSAIVGVAGRDEASPAAVEAFWRDVRSKHTRGMVLTTVRTSDMSLRFGHLAVALDISSFDFVPYQPYTIAAVARIIEQGYGIPFADPPPDLPRNAPLPDDAGRVYWAQLAPNDWCQMSGSLGVTAVVAPHDWIVKLPPSVTGPEFTYYKLPCG
jgi:hypothetical protein